MTAYVIRIINVYMNVIKGGTGVRISPGTLSKDAITLVVMAFFVAERYGQ